MWWDRDKVDIRLLTDPDEQQVNRDTALRFAEKGKIKKLRGIHAKMYIVDDRVLLTSANLTCAGFARRYEAGVVLSGRSARSAISLFQSWWDLADDFPVESVRLLPRAASRAAVEDARPPLPDPVPLPAAPADFGGEEFIATFGDYPEFLRCYQELAQAYISIPQVWSEMPLYLEIDAFLDYLFRYGGRPSRAYTEAAARHLTPERRESEIRRYALMFQSWAQGRGEDRKWRLTNSRAIRRLLAPSRINYLSRSEIGDVAGRLNCLRDGRVRNKFLRHPGNTTRTVKKVWSMLLHGHKKALPTDEMAECARTLFGFKRSSVQELLGWYLPKKFPIRNLTVNAGLRFFGYDVRPR